MGKLLIFVCAVFLWQFAHIRSDLIFQEDEKVEDFSVERNIDDVTEDFAKDPPLHAGCKCDKGKCVQKNGKEVCECPPEFGLYTPNSCKACECGQGANCTFESTGWFSTKKTCICSKGYILKSDKCVGPCEPNPCKNKGTCKDVKNGFECICPSKYTGKTCEKKADACTPKPCKNGGTCIVKGKGFKCTCKAPYTGDTCEETLDPCASKPCQNGGTCAVKGTKFNCTCKAPYTGDTCEKLDPCASKPCQNGGTCTNKRNKFSCTCKAPYTGDTCEKLDPCASKPCQNGGICTAKGTKFNCSCKAPYTGDKCEKLDPCASKPCQNGGTCTNKGTKFNCTCKVPFFGDTCEKVCKCENGKCRLTAAGEEMCDCLPEFGKYDDNVCKACDCGTGANCTFNKGIIWDDKYCICPDGSTLENMHCEDPCKINPCKNGGTCKPNGKSKTKCECKLPYTGPNCEQDLCSNKPCQNGGTCEIKGASFQCKCKVPYSGQKCEKDPCTEKPCLNGGICKVDKDSFICNCTEPYSGKKCEKVKTSTTWTSPPTTNTTPNTSTSKRLTSTTNPTPHTSPDFNETTYTPSNFTEEINITTYEPSNFTGDFNLTTYEPSNFTDDFNITTNEPSNFTGDFIFTTNEPSNFTGDFNFTTSEPSNFTGDFNFTTNEPSNFTGDFNFTTSEPSNFTGDFNFTTNEPSNFTGEYNISTSKSTGSQTTTTNIPDVCSKNPCQNGGTCVANGTEATCICAQPYAGKTCNESHWCIEGPGKTLCPERKCAFNFKTKVGRCECVKDQYFNYEKKQCETIDRCPFMPGKCTGQNEICKNGECRCVEHFTRNSEKKCVPNFCASNSCGENEVCEDLATDPGNVKCKCKKNFFFNGKSCLEGNICSVPSVLGCKQICNATTESCECTPGFTLQPDKKSCMIDNSTDLCSQKCGEGVCVLLNNEETCICHPTHLSNGSYCLDLCSAGRVPKGLCPHDECRPDDKLGFKCKCEGKLTYDETGVTCRKKLMCSEGNGTGTCAKYNARCVEDPDRIEGFRCVCEASKGPDTDGVCKNKCELSKKKEECQARKATCELDGLNAICKCPPMLTFDYTGQCAQLVKISYSGELPLAMSRYVVKKQSSPSKQAEENSINYEAIKKDLRASMHVIYGENYKFADILSCSIIDQDVKCSFEIQFHNDPKDQVNLITDDETCVSADADNCFIPPSLLIDKKNLKPGSFAETDPCLKDIKDHNCGRETNCKKVEGKGLNFECTCAPGFETYAIVQPFYDSDTVIQRCQDIDECSNQKACPNRTRCLNSYGSYECLCLKGFRPLTATSDPKISGCVDVCDATVCKHGKCQVIGEVYGCLCDAGYTGLSCDLEEKTAGNSGMRTALIILSTLVVPLILFSIFILYKYRLLLAKNFQSNYFDDQNSSTINLRPISNNGQSSS